MKQKPQKKIRSPLIKALLHILKFLIDTIVFCLRINKSQNHPTTRELMLKLSKQDPSLFDSKPSPHRHRYKG